jgi:AcrR family transcriptional regulator
VATQEQRRADTRRRLLDAAAGLFAVRGVEGASIDAIAELADRTSGAVYDHFGGKEGLLFALLDGWVDDVAAVITAELATATTLEERLATLWRNVAEPPSGDGRWIALEHELWSWAARHPEARDHLARRYRIAFEGVEAAASEWLGEPAARGTGATVIGLLLGLEMMRRIDGSAVDEGVAVAALQAAVTGMSDARRSRHSTRRYRGGRLASQEGARQ